MSFWRRAINAHQRDPDARMRRVAATGKTAKRARRHMRKQEKPVVSAIDKCRPSKGSSEDKGNEAQGEQAAENSTVCESAGNAVHTEGVLRQANPGAAVLKESCEKNDQAIAVSKKPREDTDVEGTPEQDDGGSKEGPPPKASSFRRSTLKPKPNVLTDRRQTPTVASDGWQTPTVPPYKQTAPAAPPP
ncbi:hypothetical protein HPB49_014820 [Dermacentor silvarum]|uniref:Uncharacterized protein n=1 Tax=Dermacentor silvarum TaxID=543639 RepID=A0ACB8DED8_DERSI|nr:hypothetical protein HPB49_014820 [Dermacentor silvarum]